MSLSVRDVLLLPALEALRLRAGRSGEHHTVRWPYVAENQSILEWVLGGELVFVTGINQPRDDANLLQLVREASEKRCAGLVVLTGPLYIQQIPGSMLNEADRLGIPLIEQPYDLPMITVTEAIGSALVQAQWLGSSRQQLIEQLLDGHVADSAVLTRRADQLSVDLSQPRQVLVVQLSGMTGLFQETPDHAEAHLQAFRQNMLQQLTDALTGIGLALPVIRQAEQLVALLPVQDAGTPARNRRVVEDLLHRLNQADTPLRALAGLSKACAQPTEWPRGLGEARQALTVAQAFPERLGLCCFEELGVLELLMTIRDRSLLDRFLATTLGPLLHHDAGHHAVLTSTLEAWMQSNGNLIAASQRLGVHRNTLNYRMQQIQSLTGFDLDNAQHRLSIAVALMIWRLSTPPAHPRTPT